MNEAAVRVLLVYGYEPSGHAAAASALEEAGRAAGLLVSRVEVAGAHHPAAGPGVARGYHALLRAWPGAWGALYRSGAARRVLRAVRASYLAAGGARRLRAGVAREAAHVVVCPQASVAAVFAEARRRGDLGVPVLAVLTDFGAHPFWADPPADLVAAPAAAAAGLARLGLPAERLAVCGIPVHPVFDAAPGRAAARRALGLPASAPVVLLTGGSKGLGELSRTAAALLRAIPRVRVLALCGRNEPLRRRLSRAAESGARLRAFGPQPPAFVAALLAAADLHVGKPGGMTSAESLAVGVPMVLARPVPGQEEENARFLLEAGAAVFGGAPEDCARAAARLALAPGALARLRAGAEALRTPGSAARAMAAAAALAQEGRGTADRCGTRCPRPGGSRRRCSPRSA